MLGKLCLAGLLACGMAAGQTPGASKASAPAKTPTFDVVSIKPTKAGFGGFGTNPGGYFAKGMPLSLTVMLAYFPVERMNRPFNMPGWPSSMNSDAYDIEAKFDRPTAEGWMRLTTAQQGEIIRPMLQAMLAERCKMVAHMTMTVEPVYELVIARHGPRLKQTAPGEAPPDHALPIGGDAMMANYLYRSDLKIPTWAEKSPFRDHFVFFRTSMPTLATWLAHMGVDRQVVDRTGLTGKYDFMLPEQTRQRPEPRVEGEASDPASNSESHFDLSGLGLALRAAKAPQRTLVIEHIEKPTPN